MNKIFYLLIILSLQLFSFESKSEINNEKVLLEVFQGCLTGKGDPMTVGQQIDYCGCIANQVSINMDIEELMLLGLDMMDKSDSEMQQSILASEKWRKSIAKCAARLFD